MAANCRHRAYPAPILGLLFASLLAVPQVLGEEGDETQPVAKLVGTVEARTVEVDFQDGGRLWMVLDVSHLEFETPYGKLSIPVEEIRRITPLPRVDDKTQSQIDKSLAGLSSADFAVRDAASKELRRLGAKAYMALLKAAKNTDPEVARHARELLAHLKENMPEEKLEVREFDVIETIHSTISGKLGIRSLPVVTTQFGKLDLKLADVSSIRSSLAEAVEKNDNLPVLPDPGNLSGLRDAMGKKFAFRVTGRIDGVCYGTGVYTTDSQLSTAAVHAGALKNGETGVVRVSVIASPPGFTATTQNGITSYDWGAYPAAYQVHVPKKK